MHYQWCRALVLGKCLQLHGAALPRWPVVNAPGSRLCRDRRFQSAICPVGSFCARLSTELVVHSDDIYWCGLAVSTKLPIWFRLCTLHNIKFNGYYSRFSTYDGTYYYKVPYRPKIMRKSVFIFSKNSRKFTHFYFPEYSLSAQLLRAGLLTGD